MIKNTWLEENPLLLVINDKGFYRDDSFTMDECIKLYCYKDLVDVPANMVFDYSTVKFTFKIEDNLFTLYLITDRSACCDSYIKLLDENSNIITIAHFVNIKLINEKTFAGRLCNIQHAVRGDHAMWLFKFELSEGDI